MNEKPDPKPAGSLEDFERRALKRRPGLLREWWGFLRAEKKWWLAPLLLSLLLVMGLVVAGGSSLAPLIYALF